MTGEDTPRDEAGDTTGDETKSQRSAMQSQRGSKAGSRPPSGGSKRSGQSEKKASVPPSPTGSAKENPAADWRNMRRIIAEDPEWSLATVPLLVELCLKHIVVDFESKENLFHILKRRLYVHV